MKHNDITPRNLNYAVQMTIDRIIFLRICEDRGIEPYGRLEKLKNGKDIYKKLVTFFKDADDKYNSGLFHFNEKEKGHSSTCDSLTPKLKIDDAPLQEMLASLYFPNPYEFSVIPADILGQVYERFLGKVIHVSGKDVVIEEKPEVKKAGGVFYTPTYIVDYIIKKTIDKLLEGKTPKQVEKLRVLDPACGSGSFLIVAYQRLLDWHLDYYEKNGGIEKFKKLLQPTQTGGVRLTTAERKRILLANIYGVDIDSQAVEVTKLSLLLKVLEGESNESINSQFKLFHERALPDLGSNIKCGNSLVGGDFYAQENLPALTDDEEYRINTFDWKSEFSEIFNQPEKDSGFDVIVGNPPYLYSAGKDYPEYFSKHYSLGEYQTDFYVYFIEKSWELLRKGGAFSYIIPDSWLNSQYFSKLRKFLISNGAISEICIFDYLVFDGASIENSIFFIEKNKGKQAIDITRFTTPSQIQEQYNQLALNELKGSAIIDPRYDSQLDTLIKKIELNSKPLEKFVHINRGVHAYRTDGYGRSKFEDGVQTTRDKLEASYHSSKKLDDSYLLEIKGKNVFRFLYEDKGTYLSYGDWLAEPRTPELFFQPKCVLRKILGKKLSGTFIDEPIVADQSLYVFISRQSNSEELKFLLGILMSSLAAWYIRTKYSIYDTLYPWYTKKQLAGFPIKKFSEELVSLVDKQLTLGAQLSTALSPNDRTLLTRKIAALEALLDGLVYKLYNITDVEIALIETND